MSDLRGQVGRLNHAATTSLQYGADANDLANFPGMMNLVAGSGAILTPGAGTLTLSISGGGVGTVTSVGMSVPSFLSVAGSPITTSGTLAVTYSGTPLPIANGGSGQTTANAALNAFLPSQGGNAGKNLQTNGTNTSWVTPTSGTVTSVGVSGNNGIGVSGSPITTSGTITLSLGAVTPTSVSTGNLTASGTISLPANSVSLATLTNSAGLSVLGRPASTSGARSDITSTGARTFLASSSANTALTFRAIDKEDFPGGDWITASNGTANAGGITSIAADSTWFDTGASISLSAGTYIVTYSAHALLTTATGTGAILGRLYNTTDAAVVANSETMLIASSYVGAMETNCGITIPITVGATKTIRLEVSRSAAGTYTTSTVRNNANGRTCITYLRVA